MKDDQDVYVDWMSKYGGLSKDMTLRDYFAAQVLMTACEDYRPIEAAQLAYAFADAMLEARK